MFVKVAPSRPAGRRFSPPRITTAPRAHLEPQAPQEASFRIVTYNVHKCRGLDRRVRPQRIVEILGQIKADIIALQEVLNGDHSRRDENQARFIAEELGLHYAFGENRRLKGSGYGNAILSRLPLIREENYDLSHAGREERGCLRADIALSNAQVLHIYNVHLGTAYLERRHQGRKLVESDILTRLDVTGPRILLGDFNEWLPGLSTRLFREHFGSVDLRTRLGRRRTYPGAFPFLHLDHIYFDDSLELKRAAVYRSGRTLLASDHLPLVADFQLRNP
ncbi:MAG: endonuclease/exonuclease/phosphatase family protein [Deltaproteobacteria bacterium]|nr:endonuclease/exonuclease/phosphatase family protein [Deltaproteobacteria bacterium]